MKLKGCQVSMADAGRTVLAMGVLIEAGRRPACAAAAESVQAPGASRLAGKVQAGAVLYCSIRVVLHGHDRCFKVPGVSQSPYFYEHDCSCAHPILGTQGHVCGCVYDDIVHAGELALDSTTIVRSWLKLRHRGQAGSAQQGCHRWTEVETGSMAAVGSAQRSAWKLIAAGTWILDCRRSGSMHMLQGKHGGQAGSRVMTSDNL